MSKLLPTPKTVLTSNTSELSERMEDIIEKLNTYNGKEAIYFKFPLTYDINKELGRCGWSTQVTTDGKGFYVKPKEFPIKFAGFCLDPSIIMTIPAITFMFASLAPDAPRVGLIIAAAVAVVILAVTKWVENKIDF